MLKRILLLLASIPAVLLLVIIIAILVIDEEVLKEWISSYVEQQYDRDLYIADLELDLLSLQPSIAAEGIELGNAQWADSPKMADVGKILVRFELLPLVLGKIKILDAEVTDGQLLLIKQPAKTNWGVFLAKDQKPGYFSLEQLKEFRLSNVIVNYKQGRTGDKSHRLLVEGLDLQEFFTAQRRGSFHGKLDSMPISFQVDHKPVGAENVDRLLTLTGHIGTAEAYFTGDVSDNFNRVKGRIRVKGSGESLTRIADLAGLNIKKALHAYDSFATINAHIEQKIVDLTDIDLEYGQSQMTGRLKADSNGERTFIKGDLVFPTLSDADLKPYIDIKAREEKVEKKELFTNDAIGPLIPGGLELYLQVAVEKFTGGSDWARVIHGGGGKFVIKGERLAFYPVRVNMLGGNLSAKGLIDQSGELIKAGLKIEIDNFELKKISEILANPDNILAIDEIIGGDFDLVTSLRFSGNSPQAMASSLSGDLGFVIEDGYMGSLLVEALQLDVTEIFGSWLAGNPKTDINCMVALFDINSGRITTQTFVINTNDSNIIGSGVINIANESVNYTLVAREKDFSITGAPINMKIEGDLIDPKLDIGGENSSLFEAAVKAIITPLAEGLEEIFGEDDERRLTHCARFRSEIARIQKESAQGNP